MKALRQSGASDSDCVDAVFASTNFERLIESAKIGDRAAAKEILALTSAYLVSKAFGQLPPELRRYLGNALAAVSLGESADIALNLKNPRGGRPRREHRTRLRIGHLIYKEMKAGKTLEAASHELEEYLEAGIVKNGKFYGYTKAPDSKTLEGIYNEVLSEIESTYHKVSSKTESTLKT